MNSTANAKSIMMWAALDVGCYPLEATRSRVRVKHRKGIGERVGRVLVTPIEPKKRGKK